ncbi:hypothetical protein GTQ34_04895 [Muricauda sp. JGD-17]|uniref:Uncharacterized protein n=1 Tax=Flagellimonas ochracea TaxID=2696472 RepID=A0A964TAG6_9FLAO|nr:hypothetical protein [Allomuricauda ochracea]NAY91250.1 hypothetical protein [Allomuricauda ochracea]
MEQMEEVTLLMHDYYSGFDEYEAMIISDTKSLKKLYSKINMTRKPGLPVPVVDFSTEQVIVLCLGKQHGDNTPILSKSEETEEHLSLAVSLTSENKDNQVDTLPISYPFYVYKMPVTFKKIDFKKVNW